MAKAKKLPSGSWRAQVYDYTDSEGKRHYESFTAETRKEAEFLAAQFALDKKERYRSDKTFGQALDDYIIERGPVLSPRTRRNYKYIRNRAIQSIMKMRIKDITQKTIQQIVNEDAKTHSPKTVRNHYGLISAVMRRERPELALNTVLPQATPPDLYIPVDHDVQKLIAAVKDTALELPVLLAAFGPMRRGEICALDSSCIKGNVVHVKQNMVLDDYGKWIVKSAKTYAGDRYIYFPDFVMEKLKGIEGRVTDLNPDALTCRFRRRLKKAEITHFRLHDLRHYSASIQHALGIPDAYIMQRGGWKTDVVLKTIYRHALDDKQREMSNTANNYFSELCNTKYNTQQKNP